MADLHPGMRGADRRRIPSLHACHHAGANQERDAAHYRARVDEPRAIQNQRQEHGPHDAPAVQVTMKAVATVILWASGCAMVILFVTYIALGCAGAPSPAQQADVVSYQTEQLACVASYATRKEIDACRDMVKARHGRLDAGSHE